MISLRAARRLFYCVYYALRTGFWQRGSRTEQQPWRGFCTLTLHLWAFLPVHTTRRLIELCCTEAMLMCTE